LATEKSHAYNHSNIISVVQFKAKKSYHSPVLFCKDLTADISHVYIHFSIFSVFEFWLKVLKVATLGISKSRNSVMLNEQTGHNSLHFYAEFMVSW